MQRSPPQQGIFFTHSSSIFPWQYPASLKGITTMNQNIFSHSPYEEGVPQQWNS